MKRQTKSPCNNTARDLVFSTCPSSIFYSVDIIATQKITFQWTCQEISNKLIRQHKPITVILCAFSFRAHAWTQWAGCTGCSCWLLRRAAGVAQQRCCKEGWNHHCSIEDIASTVDASRAPAPKHCFLVFFFKKVYTPLHTKSNLFGHLKKCRKIPNVKTSST